MSDALASELREIAGGADVLEAPDLRAPFERDWTGRFGAPARLVVRPADTAEVAGVLAACASHGARLVPQGGNTGLVGGGVPRGGEVVLSLARLRGVGDVDAAGGQLEVGAGATLADVQRAARGAGLEFGVDFGARDGATVGGMVATDAGGIRAVRHGTMRAQVLGLEAVLADGSVVRRMAGLPKDNAGYDLAALLVGSEGTLGVITRARLRLVPSLPHRATALVGLDSVAAAVELLAALRAEAPGLEAADFLFDDGLELACTQLRASRPLGTRCPVYALVECAGRSDPLEELAAAVEASGVVRDVAVADDTARRAALWRFREAVPEAIAAAGVPHKLDVGVPLARLAEFCERVRDVAAGAEPGARTVLFGHLGDGNVHVNVLGPDPESDRVDDAVLRLVAACDGTISAEHGVGVAKARWLGLTHGPAERAAMAAVKRALDPDGVLNPGVILA